MHNPRLIKLFTSVLCSSKKKKLLTLFNLLPKRKMILGVPISEVVLRKKTHFFMTKLTVMIISKPVLGSLINLKTVMRLTSIQKNKNYRVIRQRPKICFKIK